ncbi:MAG: PAS domain-containing protein [Bacteroidota bacterium]
MNENLPNIYGNNQLPSISDLVFRITDEISTMLAYWDRHQVCRFANRAYLEWFGKRKEDMINKITMHELLGPLYHLNLPYIKAALEGKKQVFEREIPLPTGGTRHSLATYIPDIRDGEVMGFFAHVADVSYVKDLEAKLLKARREMLRTVIDTQEMERFEMAASITENINQTLASCNILLYSNDHVDDKNILDKITAAIRTAINDLNDISISLRPPGIDILGFVAAIENYIIHLKPKRLSAIRFSCSSDEIELLSISNKRFIFRIIQAFIRIVNENVSLLVVDINVTYQSPAIEILFTMNDPNYKFNRDSKQFLDILYRVDYYEGTIEEISIENKKIIRIAFSIE